MIADIRVGKWRLPALLILAVSAIVMALVLVWVGQGLTFWLDEWDFVFRRQTFTIQSFVTPHVDAFVLVPALVYYVVLHVWGLSSYYPILAPDWLAHFLCVGLLALVVSWKSGVLIGLMAGLSLLFLGSAYEALLQPFQMQYLFSTAGGLLAFALLDREVRSARVYVAAAVALIFAIASSGVGPIFTGLILVWALVRRERAALLAAVPALVSYGIWYVAWQGRLARIPGTAENLVHVPVELLYGIGAAAAGVTGLPPMRFAWVGAAIVVAIGIALVFLVVRRRARPTPLAVAALFALATEYGLHAFFRGAMGLEHAARSAYLYPAAVFVWLAVAGTIGMRLDPRRWTAGRRPIALALIGLLIVPMTLANMTQFFLAARALQVIRATEARELTLIERLRDVPGVDMDVSPDGELLGNVAPGRYFTAIDQFGSPHIAGASDDLPGPDGARLNAVAMQLLGDAVTIGPPGGSGTAAPALNVLSGMASPDGAAACTILRPLSGAGEATWSPSAAGVAFRLEGAADRDPAVVQLFLGLFEPADQPADATIQAAVQRGETIWLPPLPDSLHWTLRVSVDGDLAVHVCSRQPSR
ncbi:MAG TPA: hypothetical protein VM284_05975 [Candidatus Limnocylindria bacterium]|nr:hypothetical protein [Candidatus Limnocylindria bacterium]